MTEIVKAFVGAQIHDGCHVAQGQALGVNRRGGLRPLPQEAVPPDCPKVVLEGGLITPGFVDLQVNGGGGVMFNDAPDGATLRTMAHAHRGLGTTALLPTLITDTPARTVAAIDAAAQAIAEGVEGIAGLHLEGPHLSQARKGAHDGALIRPMTQDDMEVLQEAATRICNLMVTLAPESVTMDQIAQLAAAGIVVSLGHTDADYDTCMAAFDAGASCVTHLFNAMSPLGSRAPGVVGAALAREDIHVGLIADGIHVHPASIRIARDAMRGADRLFLVSDAMAPAGTDIASFELNGRQVHRRDGRLTLADGTLAGADLDLPRAVSLMAGDVGDDLSRALARATSMPAGLLRDAMGIGGFDDAPVAALYFKGDIAAGAQVLTAAFDPDTPAT